jgi:hypothetical protein
MGVGDRDAGGGPHWSKTANSAPTWRRAVTVAARQTNNVGDHPCGSGPKKSTTTQ